MNINISNTYVLLAAPPRLAITKISNKNSVVSTKLPKKEKSKNRKIKTVISKPRFWKKHNELQIVTLKNRDPDILDHLFQKKCYDVLDCQIDIYLAMIACCRYLEKLTFLKMGDSLLGIVLSD